MVIFTVLVLIGSILFDPDAGLIQQLSFGAGTLAMVLIAVRSILYIALLHVSRKALFDYLDLEEFFVEAKKGNSAAGLAIIGVGITLVAVALLIMAAIR